MCNHYANDVRKLGPAMGDLFGGQFSEKRIPLRFDNLATHVYPDRLGLIIRRGDSGEGFAMETMRWGFPPPPNAGAHYVTNVRNTTSGFWKRWLEPEWRCLVPATAFAEYGQETPKREHWFARTDGAPMWFAGIWREWEGVRGTKKAPEDGAHRIFSFLTCEPNAVVAPVHPKAMPVVLGPNEADAWLSYPTAEALKSFQRPLPDDLLIEIEKPDA